VQFGERLPDRLNLPGSSLERSGDPFFLWFVRDASRRKLGRTSCDLNPDAIHGVAWMQGLLATAYNGSVEEFEVERGNANPDHRLLTGSGGLSVCDR
jgi:hypothetical protein